MGYETINSITLFPVSGPVDPVASKQLISATQDLLKLQTQQIERMVKEWRPKSEVEARLPLGPMIGAFLLGQCVLAGWILIARRRRRWKERMEALAETGAAQEDLLFDLSRTESYLSRVVREDEREAKSRPCDWPPGSICAEGLDAARPGLAFDQALANQAARVPFYLRESILTDSALETLRKLHNDASLYSPDPDFGPVAIPTRSLFERPLKRLREFIRGVETLKGNVAMRRKDHSGFLNSLWRNPQLSALTALPFPLAGVTSPAEAREAARAS